MADLVAFPGTKPQTHEGEPEEAVVTALEILLKAAMAGELRAFACVGFWTDERFSTTFAGDLNKHYLTTLGGVEELRRELYKTLESPEAL